MLREIQDSQNIIIVSESPSKEFVNKKVVYHKPNFSTTTHKNPFTPAFKMVQTTITADFNRSSQFSSQSLAITLEQGTEDQ